jgi:hypothetical protein
VATPLQGSATSQPGSPDSPATPASLPVLQHPGDYGPGSYPRDDWKAMSTRYLIIIALITGLVILAASAIQFLMVR